MKMIEYCEHIANLCVVTVYNLDKFSPCNIFYTAQTTVVSAGTDSYQTKLVPFLFYAKGHSTTDDLDKVIDHRYKYTKYDANHNSVEYEMFTPYPVISINFQPRIKIDFYHLLFIQHYRQQIVFPCFWWLMN